MEGLYLGVLLSEGCAFEIRLKEMTKVGFFFKSLKPVSRSFYLLVFFMKALESKMKKGDSGEKIRL